MTTLSGMLSTRNNKHMLLPHAVAQGKQHWGRPSTDAIVQALKEVSASQPVGEGSGGVSCFAVCVAWCD